MNLPLSARLDALKQPSPTKSSYGDDVCGCSWDSGPYPLYCRMHDPERLMDDLLQELSEAAQPYLDGRQTFDERERFEEAVRVLRRVLDEGVEPAT